MRARSSHGGVLLLAHIHAIPLTHYKPVVYTCAYATHEIAQIYAVLSLLMCTHARICQLAAGCIPSAYLPCTCMCGYIVWYGIYPSKL